MLFSIIAHCILDLVVILITLLVLWICCENLECESGRPQSNCWLWIDADRLSWTYLSSTSHADRLPFNSYFVLDREVLWWIFPHYLSVLKNLIQGPTKVNERSPNNFKFIHRHVITAFFRPLSRYWCFLGTSVRCHPCDSIVVDMFLVRRRRSNNDHTSRGTCTSGEELTQCHLDYTAQLNGNGPNNNGFSTQVRYSSPSSRLSDKSTVTVAHVGVSRPAVHYIGRYLRPEGLPQVVSRGSSSYSHGNS
ncbi:hypothetical protein BDZ89DRAFT_448062 [Hymenopellis radicata]|nr:hypothetical protein BDZ89DRAFT_448062 [Hymenopellis radicata]